MRTAAKKNYTEDDLRMLSGKIQQYTYCQDVQDVLASMGTVRTHNYITQVVNQNFYNEQVWDAVRKVLEMRKIEQQIRSRMVAEAVSS